MKNLIKILVSFFSTFLSELNNISENLKKIANSLEKIQLDLQDTDETQNTNSSGNGSSGGEGDGIGEEVPIILKRYKNNDVSNSILLQVENLVNPFLMFHVAIMEKLAMYNGGITNILNEYFALHLYLQPNLQIIDNGVKVRVLREGFVITESVEFSKNNTPTEFEFPTSYTYQTGDKFEFYTPNTGVTLRNWYNQEEISLTPNQYYQLN